MRVEAQRVSAYSIILSLFLVQAAEASTYPFRLSCPVLGTEVSASQNRETKNWDTVLTVRAAFTQVEVFVIPYAWWGAYGRSQYNLDTDAITAAAGLGAGLMGLGLEIGAVGQKKKQNYGFGGEFTALLSAGYLGFFSRFTLITSQPKRFDIGIRLNYLFLDK